MLESSMTFAVKSLFFSPSSFQRGRHHHKLSLCSKSRSPPTSPRTVQTISGRENNVRAEAASEKAASNSAARGIGKVSLENGKEESVFSIHGPDLLLLRLRITVSRQSRSQRNLLSNFN